MFRNVLFIGNGLNRCYYHDLAWNNLLKEIASEYNISMNTQNSFPMEFECIINQILEKEKVPSDKIYSDVKSKIVSHIRSVKELRNPLHERFMEIPVHAVITSNYDYLLERAYNGFPCIDECSTNRQKGHAENKYSLNRYTTIKDRRFYHMHGELSKPDTLCLGSEHYAGYLARIRESIKRSDEENKINKDHILEIMRSETERNTWVDLLFNKDIHIVGLGLSQCEIDLWWVITYRAFLYYTNKFDARNNLKNKITYYDIVSDKDKPSLEKEILKHNLTKQHVVYTPFTLKGDNYEKSYQEICNAIMDSVKNQTPYRNNL
jgi:hypothetical protein